MRVRGLRHALTDCGAVRWRSSGNAKEIVYADSAPLVNPDNPTGIDPSAATADRLEAQ